MYKYACLNGNKLNRPPRPLSLNVSMADGSVVKGCPRIPTHTLFLILAYAYATNMQIIGHKTLTVSSWRELLREFCQLYMCMKPWVWVCETSEH